jgi:predicted MFS family arabinose efflux permease
MRGHLARRAGGPPGPRPALLRRPAALLALAAVGVTMMSNFAVVPNIAAHLQADLGFPREHLGLMYMIGGAVAFVVLRVAGRAVDRFGEARVAAFGTAIFLFVLAFGFAFPAAWFPVPALFVGFMGANSLRSVSMQSVSSRVPAPHERARFMSTQSAVQHLASALGASLSTRILSVLPDGRLGGIPSLAAMSGGLALCLPFFLGGAAAFLRRDRARAPLGAAVEPLGS